MDAAIDTVGDFSAMRAARLQRPWQGGEAADPDQHTALRRFVPRPAQDLFEVDASAVEAIRTALGSRRNPRKQQTSRRACAQAV